jgi:pimeloyl-ACP methyl ester carboxylesterase
MAEARRQGTFAAICCYEPVVFPVDSFSARGAESPPRLAELARKRRSSFPSKRAAYENYASKPPFSRFDPAALDAYVTYGFVDEPGGTVTLACARQDEASVFDGAPSSPAWDRLPQVRCPVTVFGGSDPSDPVGRVVEIVARRLPEGTAKRFDQLDHFGPFVDPVRVGTAIAAAFGASGDPVHQEGHTS